MMFSAILLYNRSTQLSPDIKRFCYIFTIGPKRNSATAQENQQNAWAKTKAQISSAVTAKLINAFVFATWIVLFLYFLNPKFQASSHLLCLCSSVWVEPVPKLHCWFSNEAAQMIIHTCNKATHYSIRIYYNQFHGLLILCGHGFLFQLVATRNKPVPVTPFLLRWVIVVVGWRLDVDTWLCLIVIGGRHGLCSLLVLLIHLLIK